MLLERERELTALASALRDAERGRGGVVLVEAPAGLGKTSLLKAACEAASEAGFACLRARASELERDFAYGCVRQLLEPVVANGSSAGLFEGAASLSRPLFAPASAQHLGPSADRAFAMLHGLYWLLNNLTDERPVVLSLDDLDWCDAESLRFLTYLAPRLDGLTLAVFASMRGGEPVGGDLARLAAAPETTLLRPRPLSVEATARLCEFRLGVPVADEFAEACRRATAGTRSCWRRCCARSTSRSTRPTRLARPASSASGLVRSRRPCSFASLARRRQRRRSCARSRYSATVPAWARPLGWPKWTMSRRAARPTCSRRGRS